MNILFICEEYPCSPHQGGIGTVTQILAEGMAKLGHTVHVSGIYEEVDSDTHETISGVTIHRLKSLPLPAF